MLSVQTVFTELLYTIIFRYYQKIDFLTKLLTIAILITMQVNILGIMKYMDITQQPYSGKYKHNVSFPMLKNNRRPSIKANTKGTTIRPHIKKIIVQLNRFSLFLWFCTFFCTPTKFVEGTALKIIARKSVFRLGNLLDHHPLHLYTELLDFDDYYA